VRDRFRQLRICAACDAQAPAVLGDTHGARAATRRQRGLEDTSGEVDAVRREFRDTVGDDRAREVDGLADGLAARPPRALAAYRRFMKTMRCE